jgi:hypothetical protein
MNRKRYIKQVVYLLSLAFIMTGCEYVPPDPPPVENQPPVITGLNDLSLPLNFGTHEIDFANYVSDQEGEIITYLVSNSNDTVITISLNNSVLTITEVGTGPSDIHVIATDGNEGHEVETTFTVTVEGIWGAPDYTGNVTAGFLDFNGFGTGNIFDYPIPGLKVEGYVNYEWESGDFGVIELAHDDHLLIVNNIDGSWIWTEYNLKGTYDFTGKKMRFDYSYFSAPTLTGTHWWEPDQVVDPAAVDIRLYFVNGSWSTGGAINFSSLNMEYSTEWQTVEIPLEDFGTLWDFPIDLTNVRIYGLEIWGGTPSAPISFRLDNFGIVD